MRRLLVTLSLVALLAGCLDAPVDTAGSDALTPALHWAEAALVSEHDHADPALHVGLSTPNFRILGHDPLVSDAYGTTVQGNLCGDAQATPDGRRLAVVETRGDVAFALVDVTDAQSPQRLGELVMSTTYVYDLAVVADGKHVVLVTSQAKTPDRSSTGLAELGAGLWWRSACAPGGLVPVAPAADALAPRPMSAILVDIQDPAQPRIVDQKPLGGFGHGVSSVALDGRTWVVATALGCTVAAGCPSHAQTFHFYEVADGPTGGRLETLSVYTLSAEEVPLNVGHNDAWLRAHPLTGQTLAYLAAWDHGLLILDMEDPRAPRLVGQWSDHDPSLAADDSGNIHSVHPLGEAWDGRHYTIIGPEIIGHPTVLPTGVVRVLDTTDPAQPFEVAAWTLPHDVAWEGRLHWSTHYLTAYGETAFVSMYHGGVWALDLGVVRERADPESFVLLPSVGAFLPVEVSPKPPERPFRWAPTLEEVHAFEDGTLVTFDSNSGLYTFAFDAASPAEPPVPWPLEKV